MLFLLMSKALKCFCHPHMQISEHGPRTFFFTSAWRDTARIHMRNFFIKEHPHFTLRPHRKMRKKCSVLVEVLKIWQRFHFEGIFAASADRL